MSENDPIIKSYTAGEVIIEQGQVATCAFLINSGKVRVFLKENEKVVDLAELGDDEIFGETSLFQGSKYGAYVEATQNTEVTVITPEMLQHKIDDCDPLLRSIMKMLVKRLSKTNKALLESETREFIDIGFV